MQVEHGKTFYILTITLQDFQKEIKTFWNYFFKDYFWYFLRY